MPAIYSWEMSRASRSGSPGSGITPVESGGVGDDWGARIAGNGVVWYHSFDTATEVNQFRWAGGYSGGQDPLALSADGPRVQWISSGGADGGGHLRLTYPLGANTGSMYWWRPFAPLTGAGNGRGIADPGANGTIATQGWTVSDGSSTGQSWGVNSSNAGWYGHQSDVDADPGEYQGTDFYLQVRVRRNGTPGAPPDNPPDYFNITGKFVWLSTMNDSYSACEIVTYGQSASNAESEGVQSRHNMYDGQDFSPIVGTGSPGPTVTISNLDVGWRYSGGWDTLLYHITPGTNGGTGANRTRVEVWAQRDLTLFPLEVSQYTKIWDVLLTQVYSSGTNSSGSPYFNGWNGLLLAIYHNGSEFTTSGFSYDYDQVIFSKATIPAPGIELPSWVPATVGAWSAIDGTAMSDVPPNPAPSQSGNTGPQSKFITWTSFAIDRRTSRVYSAANGGHNDYPGNEVFDLLLETESPGWHQLRAPYVGSYPADVDYYAANEPTSRHSYYGQQFDEFTGTGRVLLWGGGRWGNGQFGDKGDAFNLNSGTYSAAGTLPDIASTLNTVGGAYAVCVDTSNGNNYFFGNFAAIRYNRSANTMSTLSSSTAVYGRNAASAFDSSRGRIFVVGGDQGEHHTWSIAGSAFTAQTLSGSEATAVQNVLQGGMVYVPSRDSFLLREGGAGSTVYEINASTFACTSMSTSGGGSVPATQNGPHNKFLYAPRLKCVIYAPEYSGNCWALRVEA